jgi:CHAT domain-containing protein
MLAIGNYDIIHFAGQGSHDPAKPQQSALHFVDGLLTADDILDFAWPVPPYFVFNTACESGRAAGGRRFLSRRSQTNELAASFLAAGVAAYAGYFEPVTETGAGTMTATFYRELFERENVGLTFLEAHMTAVRELYDLGNLTGYSAVLFGDAASTQRRDLAMSV